jgi:hypothetical protein
MKSRIYLLTFNAKTSAKFVIPSIKLTQAASPWTPYAAPYSGLFISNGWNSYMISSLWMGFTGSLKKGRN